MGILYGRKELLEQIDFPKLKPAPNYSPERAETGTQNHEGIAGAAAAVDFIASLASSGSRRERLANVFAELHVRQHDLITLFWNALTQMNGVSVYGPPPHMKRTSTVSFTIEGKTSEAVTSQLAEKGLFTSNGDFYAATIVEQLGVEGLVRVGFACYTTEEEVVRLIEAVENII